MAPTEDSADINYLLLALKNAEDLKVNYRNLATDAGITAANSANTAQKRFKALVEKSGAYKLVNGKVIDNPDAATASAAASAVAAVAANDDEDDPPATPSKKRKSRRGRFLAMPRPEHEIPPPSYTGP